MRSCPRSFGGGDPTLTLRVRFHNFSRSDLMTLCIALQSYFWDDSVRFQGSIGKCSDLATGSFRLTLNLRPIHMWSYRLSTITTRPSLMGSSSDSIDSLLPCAHHEYLKSIAPLMLSGAGF